MDTEYSIREYQQEDEGEIVDLLNTVFEGWPKIDLQYTRLDHWRWKYQENYLNWKPICVAEKDGKIIGAIHTLPQKIKLHEDTFLTAIGGDVAVLKEYRRLGVWNAILELNNKQRKKAGIIFTFQVTNNPIVVERFEKSTDHFRFPLDIAQYVRIRDLDYHIKNNPMENAWIQKMGYHTLKTVSNLKRLISAPNNIYLNVQVNDIKHFDEGIDRFWDKIKSHYNIIIQSDQKNLNWRYCDLRAGTFVVKQAVENGEIVGFTILQINRYRPEYPVGTIAELLYMPGRIDVLESLISESVDYFDKNDVNVVVYLSVKYPQLNETLERNGFLDSRTNHHIYYTILTEEEHLRKSYQTPPETQHFSRGNLV
jgi:GNAT superfamily N-acetyltransferase